MVNGRAKGRGWSKLDLTVDDVGLVDSTDGSDNSSEYSLPNASVQSTKSEISIVPHQNSGAYIALDKDFQMKLVTRCTIPVDEGYGEDTFSAELNEERCMFRNWSPYQSKLAAALLKGVKNVQIVEGTKLIYLGVATGCPVSHIADIVGDSGIVYAVETSPWANGQLLEMAKRRHNVVAIIDDPMLPYKYRKLVEDRVDFIFCDTQHHEQLRILILHARHFLKPGGNFAIMLPGAAHDSIKAMNRLHAEQLDTIERISLQPYVRGQYLLVGVYNQS
ncbi:rRNA 2'-O-methyltransferase fibrillarin [Drosophila grimshawi]|uniref:rRNA 2'-O-methyltransferase fibrillarin n=1 Tax=Drosophila grimshawi TaxID=7222 RepID=B4JEY3_DROGR|nr:rRNA 2'-O-methyltransferase fibrillarin [Drosophila grimshawi]EDV93264.1 GH19203 [Drosophila grimshawi]